MSTLVIRNLVKKYGDLEVLKDINLEITQGDFFALLGVNGAGKTTMIGIITDLVKKTSGTVEVGGHDIDTEILLAKSKVGVVPQEFNFDIFMTVQNVVLTYAGYFGVPRKLACERLEPLLKKLTLWDKRHAKAMSLSGGMKRRLMIARALIHEPEFLILDEPTAGVDINLRKEMWEYLTDLNRSGMTILLTTHYLEEVEALCNKIAILHAGEILRQGDTKTLMRSLEQQSYVLCVDAEVGEDVLEKLSSYSATAPEPCQISLVLHSGDEMHMVFDILAKHNLRVQHVENATNSLEEIFLNVTK